MTHVIQLDAESVYLHLKLVNVLHEQLGDHLNLLRLIMSIDVK